MRVRVRLFGPYATAMNAGYVDVDVCAEPALRASAVLAAVALAYPPLGTLMGGTARLAVNHEFAPPQSVIREGDEVALIGMVSGG